MCDPGDSMVSYGGFSVDPTLECPVGRECYVLKHECGNTLCMVAVGKHCDDTLACNPGDATTSASCVGCYEKRLCGKVVYCLGPADAGPAPDVGSIFVDVVSETDSHPQ
jgi:hypothetical protein